MLDDVCGKSLAKMTCWVALSIKITNCGDQCSQFCYKHSVSEREKQIIQSHLNSMRKHSSVQEYFSCLIIFNIIHSSKMHFSILVHKS